MKSHFSPIGLVWFKWWIYLAIILFFTQLIAKGSP